MTAKLIERRTADLAQLVRLVKTIRPVQIEGPGSCWGLLVEGRGFTRLLAKELPEDSPTVWRPRGWGTPRPQLFRSRAEATRYLENAGLSR